MDASEAELKGDVRPVRAGGAIRYRVWPTQRKPWRSIAAALLVIVATSAAWWFFHDLFYPALVLVSMTLGMALLLFPTDVTVDGYTLHLRQFGSPLVYDIRTFRRMDISKHPLRHVELRQRQGRDPRESVEQVVIPLPSDSDEVDAVLVHLRRWIGRTPTGSFQWDDDHAPEDTVE